MYTLLLVFALDASMALGANVIHMPFQKFHTSNYRKSKRSGDFSVPLKNLEVGYRAEVEVGTPSQSLQLVVDTGSSDVWMTSSDASFCQSSYNEKYYCSGGTFDQSSSSTFNKLSTPFKIQYEDQTGSKGYYFTDTFSISGQQITKQQMGLALETSIGTGIMGVGFQSDEAVCVQAYGTSGGSSQHSTSSSSKGGKNKDFEVDELLAIDSGSGGSSSLGCHTYPSVVSQMVSQGLINTQAYSLWLNDLNADSGEILFGGIDTEKFTGDLSLLEIQRDSESRGYTSFSVVLSSVSLTANGKTQSFQSSSLSTNAILDSGTSLTILPDDITQQIFNLVGVEEQQGYYLAKCSEANVNGTFNFQFGGSDGPTIQVPINEMFESLNSYSYGSSKDAGDQPCIFGIEPAQGRPILLGDTFLRSAYVVYDLDNRQIGLAQTNFNAKGSNVQEIQSGSSGIPNVSGSPNSVAASVVPTAAASQAPAGHATGSIDVSAGFTATGSGIFAHPSSAAATATNVASQLIAGPSGGWIGSAVAGAVVSFAALGSALLLI